MRRLFIVLAKIFGLLQFYRALVNFVQIGAAIGTLLSNGRVRYDGEPYIAGLIGVVMYFVISLGVAWILLMRTEWLANKLKVKEEGDFGEIKEGAILRTGAKLIGLYVMAYAIPTFVRNVLDYGAAGTGVFGIFFWTKVIPATLQLALGIFLTIKTDVVLAFIAKAEQIQETRRVFFAVLGFIALVIVLGLAIAKAQSRSCLNRAMMVRDDRQDVIIRNHTNASTVECEEAVTFHSETPNIPDAKDENTKPRWQRLTNSQDIGVETAPRLDR